MEVDNGKNAYREAISSFLETLASAEPIGRSSGKLLLEYGHEFVGTSMAELAGRDMPRQCFSNAKNLLITQLKKGNDRLRYAEGYACSGSLGIPLPIQHAWLVDEDGSVVDSTWSYSEQSLYFGITFQNEYVLEAYENKVASLLDNRLDQWALLSNTSVQAIAIDVVFPQISKKMKRTSFGVPTF
jgi:hypothetical protein